MIEEPRPNRGNGYKDWFIENYKKPALTMEVSPYVGERKVPIKYYQRIFQQNKNVPIIFAKEVLLSGMGTKYGRDCKRSFDNKIEQYLPKLYIILNY